jgi:hypothetical protein
MDFTAGAGLNSCKIKIFAPQLFLLAWLAVSGAVAQDNFSFTLGEASEMPNPGVPNYIKND